MHRVQGGIASPLSDRLATAADVLDVPTLLIADTDAESDTLLTCDIDPYDRPFLTGERTRAGYYGIRRGLVLRLQGRIKAF